MGKTVFYIWQNDRPRAVNRFFIREAARAAVQQLSDELGMDVTLDFDTWNVPGSPKITDVILDKIRNPDCLVVLADVTTVGRADDPGSEGNYKALQNPNAMFEVGFALALKDWTRIILVVNRAFGSPKDLPFDLGGNRHPVEYDLATTSGDVKKVQRGLTADLVQAIRLVLQAQEDWGKPTADVTGAFEVFRRFSEPSRFAPTRESRAVLGLAIVPEVPPRDESKFFDALNRVYGSTDLLKPIRATGYGSKVSARTFRLQTGVEDGLPRGEVEVSLRGALFSGTTDILDAPGALHVDSLGQIPVFYVHRYLQALAGSGIAGQCWIQAVLRGVKGLQTTAYAPGETRAIEDEEIAPAPVSLLLRNDVRIEDVAQRIKPITDAFWRESRGVNTPALRF